METTQHPSYSGVQQVAQDLSGKPWPDASLKAPVRFNSASLAKEEDADEDELPLSEIYRDAEEESKRLKQAMEEYDRSLEPQKKPKNLRLPQNMESWDDVLTEVGRATAQYNDPSGISGKIRKWFRRSSEKANSAKAWLNLLPTQSDYFSVMCGGLKLILGAACRMNDLRDDIARALMRIPTLMACTNRDLNIYRRSQDLHRCSSDLFVAAIALIEHILRYYCVKQTNKFFGALCRQGDYERELSDKIDMLVLKSENFTKIAESCGREAQEDVRNKIQGLQKTADLNCTEMHEHLDVTRMEIYASFVAQNQTLTDQNKKLVADLQAQLHLVQQSILEGLCNFLSSNGKLDPKTQDFRAETLPPQRKLSKSGVMRQRKAAKQHILTQLDFDETMIQSDIQRNLAAVHRLQRPAQDRIISIIRHQRLQEWLVNPSSSILYLNGNNTPTASSRGSPTSFVCAKLLSSIQCARLEASDSSVSTIVVSFFCADHMNHPCLGAVQIIQCLISQLLVQYESFETSTILELRDGELDDLDTLCSIFTGLISELPPEIILFCIIDAITLHEESETRRTDMEKFLDCFSNLLRNDNEAQCRFKVLLTSPRVSKRFWRRMGQDDVLTLPEKIQSQGGFTAAKWNAYMGNAEQSFMS